MTDRDERLAGAAGTSGGEILGGSAGEELGAGPSPEHVDTSYLRTLLLLLLAATFFEGYDGAILALVLPSIQDTFTVTESQLGVSRAVIELGLGAAFFLARAGDRWGRRTLLLWSVLGYTVMTTLTAVSWDLWSFTVFQSVSRIFLGAEYAVALTMIVEEFPKERRARAIGALLMCSAIGALAVAGLLLAGIDEGPLEWRTLYLVGIVPLLFLAVFRTRLRETQRFRAHAEDVARGGGSPHVSFWEPWHPAYRRTLVLVGLIHLMRSLPLFGATSWFFYYAQREAGMEESFLYLVFIGSYGFGTLGYWVCGVLMERLGRRPTAIAYGVLAAVSASALFQARSPGAIAALMLLAVFFGLGMAPVLGAISTELFPTYIRNSSAAWARNIFEIAGFVLGPLLVGVVGDHYTGALGSVGDTVSIMVLLFLPGTWLIWRHLPETKGRELEEIEHELGTTASARRGSAPAPVKAWLVAAAVTVVAGVPMGAGVVALGGFTQRPEGAAERFLQAVGGGEADALERYGSAALAQRLFGTEAEELEQIEVGRAVALAHIRVVPFRAVVEGSRQVVAESLIVESERDGWRVTDFAPRGPLTQLSVPSEGGPGPRGAPVSAYAVAVIVVVGLTALAEVVLRALRADPQADRMLNEP